MTALLTRHNPNPLGDYLREKRLDQGKTLKKASQDLNISIKYLEALENNQPGMMPGPEYFDRYLSSYVKYLKIDPAEADSLKSKSEIFKHTKDLKKQAMVAWTEYWVRAAIIIIAMVLVIFLAIKVNAIFMPPELKIISPQDGLITVSRQLEVKGLSTPEAEIVINNMAVYVDPAGNFSTPVDLQKGLNLIKITAKKRYSRTSVAEIRVLFNE
ncbi:MAG: helix-turn-helix domain-containing protein [Candidatus Buchananbacteria bacterium]|jgi:transcriptional regulator with XRE-family HTH domain